METQNHTITHRVSESQDWAPGLAFLSWVTGPKGRGHSLCPSVALRGEHASLEPPLCTGLAAG